MYYQYCPVYCTVNGTWKGENKHVFFFVDGNEFTSFNSIHQEEFVEEENEEEEADEKSSNSPVLFVGQSASKTETMEKVRSFIKQVKR